jgi:hypothetical protein
MMVGGGGNDALSTTSVRYVGLFTQQTAAAEDDVQQAMTVAGTLSRLRVRLTSAPGAGKSYAVVVRRDGADTSLGCSVAGASQACADDDHAVPFDEGSLISLRVQPSGTPTGADMSWTARYGN